MVLSSTLTVQATTIKDVFDASYYSKTYSDLAKAFADNADALYNHYLTYGQKEGRVVVPYIDLQKYKEAYADLRAAFGDNWDAYLQHYLTYGVKEGRKSFGKAFDARAYADRYPDLKKAFGYDVLALYKHYLQFGKAEGRNAMPDAPKAATSSIPSTPSNPSTPENPSKPDNPSTPDNPNWPVNPGKPDKPAEEEKVTTTGSFKTEDGKPLANATVTFTKQAELQGLSEQAGEESVSGSDVAPSGTVFTTHTNADGSFSIQLPPGRYSVEVSADGCLTLKIENFKVDPQAEAKPVIPQATLLSKTAEDGSTTATVTGKAYIGETETIVSGVRVIVFEGWDSDENGKKVNGAEATTGEDGSYTISNLPRGYYTVVFAKDGYENSYANITATGTVTKDAGMVKTGGEDPKPGVSDNDPKPGVSDNDPSTSGGDSGVSGSDSSASGN